MDDRTADDTTPRPAPAPEDTAEEHVPTSSAEVEKAAAQVELLAHHRHSFDDAAGINPRRAQGSTGEVDNEPADR